MATTTVDTIKAQAVKPLYAVAGATELAYEFASGYATEAQKTAQSRLADVQKSVSRIERDPKALQNQAVTVLNARLDELTKDAKKAQGRFEARVTELQKDAQALPAKLQSEIDDAVTELAQTYAELVDRGEKLVAAIRKDGVKAVTAVRKAPSRSSVVRRERAKAAADNPSNSSRPVKKSATKKATAKKTPARTTANKATAAKKTAAKKTTAARNTAAKKVSA
jgi:ribosomal protein L16 Arg81 hydroxylase